MTDNFELLKNFLRFDEEGTFYFVQIIKRRKDPGNEDMVTSDYVIKSYYVDNLDYFNRKREEIVKLCDTFNARAYINISRRSYKKVALETLKNIADCISSDRYASVGNCYNSACGVDYIDKLKLLDVDEDLLSHKKEIKDLVGQENIIIEVPTVSGVHVICKNFNPIKVLSEYLKLVILKNGSTLLYYGN